MGVILDGVQMDYIGSLVQMEEDGVAGAKTMLDIISALVKEIKNCGGEVQCEISDGQLFQLPLNDYIR